MDTLEALRNRLNQVHISLRKLSDQILHASKLSDSSKTPSYGQFQNQFHILVTQLHSITNILENEQQILQNANVYPLPTFPTSHQEGLLTTLLRKKPAPEVETWIQEAIDISKLLNVDPQKDDEFCQWCLNQLQTLRNEFQFYGFLSTKELRYLETEQGKLEADRKKDIERSKQDFDLNITNGKKPLDVNSVQKFLHQGKLEANT